MLSILLVIDEHVAEELQNSLLDKFPSNAIEFNSSHYATLLPRLSSYLYFLAADADKLPTLTDCYQATTTIPEVLKGLSSATFGEEPDYGGQANEVGDDELWPVRKKQNQRQSMQARKARKQTSMPDPRLTDALKKLGKEYPSTRQEADSLMGELLSLMKGLLNVSHHRS